MIVISTDDKGVKVWRNDKNGFPTYSLTISKKNDDGTYGHVYQNIRFKKGVEVDNGETIIIKNAFPTFSTGKDGKNYQHWMITDFEFVGATDDGFMQIGVDEEVEW